MRFAILLVGIAPLFAQDIKLPPSLERLAAKATDVVDVTMDSNMLQLASRFLSDKDADEVKAKRIVTGLKGIYVRSFEFEKPGEYQESDVEAVRSQLRAPEWSRIVGVRSRKSGENADVFIRVAEGKITGLTVIATEPKELTIVNISGTITPEQLQDLGGNFGIPKLDMKNKASEKSKSSSGKED
jgi:hypothetical protein